MMMEDNGDEVKVFRRGEEDADDDTIGGESSEQQLADDKKEAVLEAELEAGRASTTIADTKPTFIKAEPSPSFASLMPGLIPGGAFSPAFQMPLFMPLVMNTPYGIRPTLSPNFMLPMSSAMSPAFGMFPTSPFYAMAAAKIHENNAAVAAAAAQHIRGGPLNPLNQMRMAPFHMPGMSNNGNSEHRRTNGGGGKAAKKDDHIKKPLNAFMWFMKENRKKLLDESGNNEKQSAELNKELGKRWHDLPKDEQQKYFEMAKKDRESHKEKYPQWSARENYAVNKKRTNKKRRDKSVDVTAVGESGELKKCRARFGVTNQDLWCKFCKRKKKCEYSSDRSTDGLSNNDIQERSSLGPSPHTSSIGRSPIEASNASDSESDVEDDDVDPTISQQAREVLTTEAMC